VGFLSAVVPGHTLHVSVTGIEAMCEIDKAPFVD
jgi:hypothetical protein